MPKPEGERDAEAGDAPEGRRAGFAVPGWARPEGGAEAGPRGWGGWRRYRLLRRRRVGWLAAGVLVALAVWVNYPFVPNPWMLLFRQPSGEASAVSGPGWWAMYGGGPRIANYVPEAAAPQGVVERVIEVGAGVRSAPAVTGGRSPAIFIGGQSRVAAFDADGRLVWERAVSGPAHGVPAVAGDALYLGTLNKRVIALERQTGRTLWEYEGDDPFPGSVTVRDGVVYAGSRGGEVYALDAESGRRLWQAGLGSPAVAPAAVDEGKLFVASTGGVLYIRHSGTGDKRARIRTGSALVAPPVVSGGQVYLLSEGGLMAFDTGVRELPGRYPAEIVWAQLWLWQFPLPAPPEHSGLRWRVMPGAGDEAFAHPPAAAPGALYLGTAGGDIVALDPRDGGLLWRWASEGEAGMAAPLLAAGELLVAAYEDGVIRAVNRHTRREVWSLPLSGAPAAPPSYAGGRLYVHTQDGRLHIIR